MAEPLTIEQIKANIADKFEENYARLRLDGGHSLASDVKAIALEQVLAYIDKMYDIASTVTDTEVRLTLPEQKTTKGRRFTIEGVVDIVRDDDETIMYDVKTHDSEYVRQNIELYEKQLNVYAHIWQTLRGEPLTATAIIATAFPNTLRDAQKAGNEVQIQKQMAEWQPLVEIPLDQSKVDGTIAEFGEIVDLIEDNRFRPPKVDILKQKVGRTKQLFATRVCRNCDARFSCQSYRNYSLSTSAKSEFDFSLYFSDFGSNDDRSERVSLSLDANAGTVIEIEEE